MHRQSIVWGTCWLYEDTETLCSFMKSAADALSKMELQVYSVIFDAKYKRENSEVKKVTETTGSIMIQNGCKIFPNKNYGVAAISKMAYELDADYIAVIDSDWKIEDFDSFIKKLMCPLTMNSRDFVIPDISPSAGRCNVLIGKPMINIFYPEYKDVIPTAFPGAFAGKTKDVYEVTSNASYHFDWGGEWDIIAAFCNKKMRITSPYLGMQNVRHRSNHSKVYDSFQIWRACLENMPEEKFQLLDRIQTHAVPDDSFTDVVLSTEASAARQIEALINISEKKSLSKTQLQLIYMVLLPLAGIMDNTFDFEYLADLETDIKQPYDRKELYKVSMLVPHCVYTAVKYSGKSYTEIKKSAAECYGNRWSQWNLKEKQKAMELAGYQIKKAWLLL